MHLTRGLKSLLVLALLMFAMAGTVCVFVEPGRRHGGFDRLHLGLALGDSRLEVGDPPAKAVSLALQFAALGLHLLSGLAVQCAVLCRSGRRMRALRPGLGPGMLSVR